MVRIYASGKDHFMYGKKHSDESKEKMRKSHTGIKMPSFTEEHKKKISDKLKINNGSKRLDVRKQISESVTKLWKDPEYRDKNIKATLKGLMKRPTTYEQKISLLLIENSLPFVYSGNGTFLIGHKNPDFINLKDKIAIEVYYDFYKVRDYGSCEEYEKQRSQYFAKYGWKTIFIREKEIEHSNWKEVCLNKINGRL